MKILAMAVTVSALMTSAASGATLFSDSFTAPLDVSKYSTTGHAQIVTGPDGGNAMNFTATQGGYDLLSNAIAGTGAGTYTLSVDYSCATVGGCGGFIGLYPGGATSTNPGSSDGWLATDTQYAFSTPFTLVSANGTSFTHNSFTFDVTSAGSFALKLEDFNGSAGDAYFRNLTLTNAAVPEPAMWTLMITGFGLVGGAARRRSAVLAA